MGIKIMLLDTKEDPLRLAFPHIFSKRDGMLRDDGSRGEPKFEATAIIKPGGANEQRIKDATAEACEEAWGPKWEAIYEELGSDEKALRKGDTKVSQSGEIYDGFEGNKYITARNTKRPGVFDRDQSTLVADDGKPYGGCFVNYEVEIWAQKPKPGVKRRVNATLLGVQFTRDGDAFGAGAAPSSASSFPQLSTEDEKSDAPTTRRRALDDD